MSVKILVGDCRDILKTLPDRSVQCVVTSPPYFGLRDYGVDGQIGLEPTPGAFVAKLVDVFREVRRVLRDDGTLWLNLGDSYANDGKWGGSTGGKHVTALHGDTGAGRGKRSTGLKPKDLMGIPWRVAFALQSDAWYLRQDIIWCLSGGAWVYARTQKGDMPVMAKDLVRLDPATVRLWNGKKWTRVLGWGPSNDESERIELVLRSGERIGCTGGHQWPTQRGNVVARDLRIGDTIQTCRLPEPDGCERPAYLTDDALWLIGLYLAEGSRNGSARQLSLSADELRWVPRIESIARHYGGSCTHDLSGGSLAVRLYGAVLHAILDAYIGGAIAIDKHLKVAAWRLPNEALSALVQGYLDGDGHDDDANGRWRLGFCRNYSLERDLRTLAARLGATLTLKLGTAKYQGGDAPTFRGEWRWERSGHRNEKDRGEIVEIQASRARGFWDIAVEDDPHLFALASGVLTHNCKPNPMPESVLDRCTKAHEYVFLLTKSPRYLFNADAIAEARSGDEDANGFRGGSYVNGATFDNSAGGKRQAVGNKRVGPRASGNKSHKYVEEYDGSDGEEHRTKAGLMKVAEKVYQTRNRRSVWTIGSEPFKEAHFATMPSELAKLCILAGSNRGDTVMDPFGGAGTTALVADRLERNAVMIELNPAYAEMARARIVSDQGPLEAALRPTEITVPA